MPNVKEFFLLKYLRLLSMRNLCAILFSAGRVWIGPAAVACCATTGIADETDAALMRALATPDDPAAVAAYLDTLPMVDGRYVVDGDVLMTERRIRLLLHTVEQEKTSSDTSRKDSPELIIDREGVWPVGKRELTYTLEKASFTDAQRATVVQALADASREWVEACQPCDLTITHVADADWDEVTFVVRAREMAATALAFFPNDPPDMRQLLISPAFFAADQTFDRIGVMRHELGHILGYRHEHVRSASLACLIATSKLDRASWLPIPGFEAIDIRSVMHYPCGGAGTNLLGLTDLDRAAHRVMYGDGPVDGVIAEDATEAGGASVVRIRLDNTARAAAPIRIEIEVFGGDQNRSIAVLLQNLYRNTDAGILPVRSVKIGKGDSGCRILERELHLLCDGATGLELIGELNPSVDLGNLRLDGELVLPAVDIQPFQYEVQVQLQPYGQLPGTKSWLDGAARIDEKEYALGGRSIFTTMGRRLTLEVPPSSAINVVEEFYRLGLPESTIAVRDAVQPKEKYSFRPLEAELSACESGEALEQGDTAFWSMLDPDFDAWPTCARECSGPHCPQIVLPDSLSYLPEDLAGSLKLFDPENAELDAQMAIAQACPKLEGVEGSCKVTRFDKSCHHATSMAAVMSARVDGEGFAGLAPGAPVALFDWQQASLSELQAFIRARASSTYTEANGPQIFVFASKFPNVASDTLTLIEATGQPRSRTMFDRDREFLDWSYPGTPDIANLEMKTLEDHTTRYRNPVVNDIRNMGPLWITAAGHTPDESPAGPLSPWILDRTSVIAPMNLGDLDNVIVVTACDPCTWPDMALWRDANYGRPEEKTAPNTARAVTIAAPAWHYVAPLGPKQITGEHGGTSQAAAFVGGVAAGMLRCDAGAYVGRDNIVLADRVKRRLVLTSTPRLIESTREAAGVVNPAAALLSTSGVFARLNSQPAEGRYAALENAGHLGCGVPWFRLDSASGALLNKQTSTRNLRRILRVPHEQGPTSWEPGDRWFLYAFDPASNVKVDIIGPVQIAPQVVAEPFISAGGRTFALAEIDELILPDAGIPLPSGCSQ